MLTLQQIADINLVQRDIKKIMTILIGLKDHKLVTEDEGSFNRLVQEEISRLSKINMRFDIILSTYSK